jgi:hypothetical protein
LSPTSTRSITVVHANHDGVDVLQVDTCELRLAFLPGIGGRLISLRRHGDELMWHHPRLLDADVRPVLPVQEWPVADGTMGSWSNVGGSKTWPAPQGWDGVDQWPGPPDPVLDGGAYCATTIETGAGQLELELVSSPDDRTGLVITRRFAFTVGSPDFVQTSTFRNFSDRHRRWAVWDVTQVDTSSMAKECPATSGIFVTDSSSDDPVELLSVTGNVKFRRQDPDLVRIPVQPVLAKLGFPHATGLIQFIRPDGSGLRISFMPEPDAPYPDEGSRVELWLQHPIPDALPEFGGLHPDAHLVELEVLSPLAELAPGGECSLTTRWTVLDPAERSTDHQPIGETENVNDDRPRLGR